MCICTLYFYATDSYLKFNYEKFDYIEINTKVSAMVISD